MANIGFICRDDYYERLSNLSDQEVGRLFRALMQYHRTGNAPELKGRESAAFSFIKYDIDTSKSNYANRVETQKNTGEHTSTQGNTPKNTISSTSTSVDEPVLFDTFWSAYPRKTGKQKARESFNRLNVDNELLEAMLKALEWQKQSEQWCKDEGNFIPHPSTWLNQHRWEDEPMTVMSKAKKSTPDPFGDALRRMTAQEAEGRVT